ncbi:hypothetical protein CRE_10389 [Caenorhabditis remanei]|uniref:Sdz-33 F-box domain-containing protein n=1 Tax=Caenorhabditis remanei TaxID=31234 RepID=E3MQI0_CAERE|nr:hypothetical protein CRE_10389 [Caenorhabditis remanei]
MDTPFLVFQKIIKLMEIIEVLEMSQTSKRMFGFIKFSRRPIQPIQLFKAEHRRTISVYEKTDGNPKLVIWLKTEKERNDVMRRMRIKNTVLDVGEKNEKTLSCYLNCDSKEEDVDLQMIRLFNHLSDLFNNKTITVWIRPFRIATSHFLFSNLQFESCTFFKILGRETDILSNKDTSQLLKALNPTVGITLKCFVEKGFGSRNLLSLPRLLITNAQWLTFEDLLNMDCETANLRYHSFTEEDVKKFINHWMDGSNPKLMHLRLHGFELEPSWEHILEGIEYGVWDEKENKKRPRNFKDHYIYSIEEIDCQNGLDFERKSDGMIGTVMHQSDWIDFFVWHDTQF